MKQEVVALTTKYTERSGEHQMGFQICHENNILNLWN